MSFSNSDSELTSTELRSKLFHSFKSKGVVQSVKTQLRKQIALELQKKVIASNSKRKGNPLTQDRSLQLRICNSLFVDHLRQCSYDYTLSVFIAESLTSLDQAFSVPDILELLKLDSKLHEMLVDSYSDTSNAMGFLWIFLENISQAKNKSFENSSAQTEEMQNTSQTLDQKLFEIEKEELTKLKSNMRKDSESIEAKLLSFQRRYEAQKCLELKNEMERFRELELANMRLEERDKLQSEFMQMKVEYEKRYSDKLKEVEKIEEDMNTKFSRQEKNMEKEAYEQRQRIILEMEAAQQRNMEMTGSHKQALNSIKMQEDKLKSKEEQLKYKEDTLREMEEHYENKVKHEIMRIKLELQEKENDKVVTTEMKEHQFADEKMDFQARRDLTMKWKEKAEELQEENQILRASVLKTKQNYEVLNQKYLKVYEKHKKIHNYEDVINDNKMLQKDLETLKKNLCDLSLEKAQEKKEHQKLFRDLLSKINLSSPEFEGKLKVLVEKEQSVRLKYEALQDKYQILQKSYTVEAKKNEELRKLYEDILLSQRDLLRQIDELKLALHFASQEKEKAERQRKREINTPSLRTRNVVNNVSPSKEMEVKWGMKNIEKRKISFEDNIYVSNDVLRKLHDEAMEFEKSYKKFQERHLHTKPFEMQHCLDMKKPMQIENPSIVKETLSSHIDERHKMDSFDLSHLIPKTAEKSPLIVTSRQKTHNIENLMTSSYAVVTSSHALSVNASLEAAEESTHAFHRSSKVTSCNPSTNQNLPLKPDIPNQTKTRPNNEKVVDHHALTMVGSLKDPTGDNTTLESTNHRNSFIPYQLSDAIIKNESLNQHMLKELQNKKHGIFKIDYGASEDIGGTMPLMSSAFNHPVSKIETVVIMDRSFCNHLNNNDNNSTDNGIIYKELNKLSSSHVINKESSQHLDNDVVLKNTASSVEVISMEEPLGAFENKKLASVDKFSHENAIQYAYAKEMLDVKDIEPKNVGNSNLNITHDEELSTNNELEEPIVINTEDTLENMKFTENIPDNRSKTPEEQVVTSHVFSSKSSSILQATISAESDILCILPNTGERLSADDDTISTIDNKALATVNKSNITLSQGELHGSDPNPVDYYMNMIPQKHDNDINMNAYSEGEHVDFQHSLHDDITFSEIETKNHTSEPSSDFEW